MSVSIQMVVLVLAMLAVVCLGQFPPFPSSGAPAAPMNPMAGFMSNPLMAGLMLGTDPSKMLTYSLLMNGMGGMSGMGGGMMPGGFGFPLTLGLYNYFN